jgi:response regulator RpfG family c-di-GMP phosphodiesterase
MTGVTTEKPGMRARPTVLCVDDETDVLEGLTDVLRRSFNVRVATSGREGLEILRSQKGSIAVVISDMRMPKMDGAAFLRTARLIDPEAVPLLLTGAADLDSAIRAVNDARLFRFLVKPCDSAQLLQACAAALSHHHLQAAQRVLLDQSLHGSIEALAQVLEAAEPAASRYAARVMELARELARALRLPNQWDIEVAAQLGPMGAIALPAEVAEKLYDGEPLTAGEAAVAGRVPIVTRRLLSRIPGLEGVLEILSHSAEGVPVAGTEHDGVPVPVGAQVMRIAGDFVQLELQGVTDVVAIGVMRSRETYDRALLETFAALVGAGQATRVREIALRELTAGMILADDVRGTRGGLLVARGQRVTEHLVERLRAMRAGSVREPVRVIDD